MKNKILILIGIVIAALSFFAPETFGSSGYITAGFITTSVAWGNKETLDYFFKPLFVGKNPIETEYFKVMLNIQSKQKLNYFGAASKILKAYAKGFSGATGAAYTQRTLETVRLKAEASDDALEFYNTVFEQGLSKGDWNDLTQNDLLNILVTIYQNALKSDIYRQAWLADKYKETVSSGNYSGTADVDYNAFDGLWKIIFDNASTSPSATQIKRYASVDGAVAQVQTLTMTGTSGTANVNVNGVNYLATFATDLNTTHANFVATHAAALALRKITLTGTTTAIFTSAVPGQPFATVTITNVSGNLAGSVAATTANTAPSALSAGEADTILNALWTQAPKVLKALDKSEKVFLVSDLVYENLLAYYESVVVPQAFTMKLDGVDVIAYRGIPVIPMGWDTHLSADFPQATSSLWAYPHRVIYTAKQNLVIGLDTTDQQMATDIWFNKDLEENRFRCKFNMGVNYVHNELMIVCY